MAQRKGTGFRTIVSDPPWKFGDKLPGDTRGAEKNYSVMSVDDICNLKLPPLADDALLFMWRVASQVEEACRVIRAWGFVPKSEIVWVKKTVDGNRHFGMGRYVRMEHEVCMIAARGKASKLVLDKGVRSVFEAKRPARHSAKPDEFYRLVDQLSPGPTVELFARRHWPGWLCLGDDLGTHLAQRGPGAP